MRSLLLALCLLALPAAAQDAPPPTNADLFAPLDLPAPDAYRTASGTPGPAYWQQRADYDIAVGLDPNTHTVTGEETIKYTNNSPQALGFLWLYLEQNLFAEGSRGAALTPADSRWRGAFAEGGLTLGSVEVVHGGETYTPNYLVDDTRMRIDLAEPLAAGGGQLQLRIAWGFVVPEYGADRMGRLAVEDGMVYELAQWFPQMAVFDDVRGWNTLPYLGQGEFYFNYGDFDLAITVPTPYTVVATGTLQNPEEVWTTEQRDRLKAAGASAERVYIIAPDELGRAHPQKSAVTTWRFRAENVRDVAWAASNRFIVDAAGATTDAGDVLVMSAYPPEGVSDDPSEPGWEEATRFGRASVLANSRWTPYPYPVMVSVAGVVGGMEYPMLHFSGVGRRGQSLFGVIDHEIAHTWFPMVVGSDERRHAWMDEGFVSFMNTSSAVAFYDENEDPSIAHFGQGTTIRVNRLMRRDTVVALMESPPMQDQTVATPADQIRRPSLGFLAYRKPGKGLLMLRNAVLGPERFDAAFRAYIERWAYKHPQPADFFRTVEDVAGEDLSWFWRGWFMSTETLDQAIASVERMGDGTVVTVENRGGLVMPADLEVTFADGQTERVRVPVEAFFKTDTFEVALPGPRRLTSVRLDPDGVLPDTDEANDVWAGG
ncbi:MAG: M1 family metallopeptidase [Bacteroidota bacterium]